MPNVESISFLLVIYNTQYAQSLWAGGCGLGLGVCEGVPVSRNYN